jgi:hypothetical protein
MPAQNIIPRIDKDAKAARNRKIFEMWLACHTLDEIADAVDTAKQTISDQIRSLSGNPKVGEIGQTTSEENDAAESAFKLSKSEQAHADHASDFEPMFYNIWKQRSRTALADVKFRPAW